MRRNEAVRRCPERIGRRQWFRLGNIEISRRYPASDQRRTKCFLIRCGAASQIVVAGTALHQCESVGAEETVRLRTGRQNVYDVICYRQRLVQSVWTDRRNHSALNRIPAIADDLGLKWGQITSKFRT